MPNILSAAQSTAPADLILTGGITLTSSAAIGFVWIPVCSSSMGSVLTSAGVTMALPTPGIAGAGAALLWDTVRNKLCVFTTYNNTWLSVTLTSS